MPINRDFVGHEFSAGEAYEVTRGKIREFAEAEAARLVTDWAGDPGAVVEYGVRFAKPVVVPDDDTGVEVLVAGRVVEKLPDRQVAVDLTATCGEVEVLSRARAVVRLD